jgi:hypothetical protein
VTAGENLIPELSDSEKKIMITKSSHIKKNKSTNTELVEVNDINQQRLEVEIKCS